MTNRHRSYSSWQTLALAAAFFMTTSALAQDEVATLDPVDTAQRYVMEERRNHEAQAGEPRQPTAAERDSLLNALRERAPKAESVRFASIHHSVTATARCAAGHVVRGRTNAVAGEAEIVAEELIDCTADACAAFQVTAQSTAPEPFDLDVSVTCAE